MCVPPIFILYYIVTLLLLLALSSDKIVNLNSSTRFRVFCYKLSASSAWGNIILVCIMFSSAMLAAEDPLDAAQKGFRNWVRIIQIMLFYRYSWVIDF